MESSKIPNYQKFINLGLFSISLVPVVLYLFVVAGRIGLPIDLEWGEGAGINQIFRMLSRETLYSAPAVEFTPLVYTPFYYWLSALLSGLFVSPVQAARWLSVISSAGAAGMIAWMVRRETGNGIASWLSAALYLACFSLSDGFYDLVRVDSLYIFLILITLVLLRKPAKPFRMIAAGLVLSLGFFTKQSALIVFLPLFAYYLGRRWKSAWPLFIATILGLAIPYLMLNARTGGWFAYYILRLPREHGYSLISAVNFWVGDLLRPLGIAVGFAMFSVLAMILRRYHKGVQRDSDISGDQKAGLDQDLYFALFACGAIGAAWVTRTSNGGGANNVMSAYAAVALLFGMGFSKAIDRVKMATTNRDLYQVLLPGLAAVQLIGLIYNPFNFIPTAAEREANELLVEEVAGMEGEAWIPYRSHLPRMVGKQSFIHAVNLFELTGYFKGEVLTEGADIVEELREKICRQEFALVVLDQPIPWLSEQLLAAYQPNSDFVIPAGERRSAQLSWQGGYEALYIPKDVYTLSSCLATIELDGNQE